MKLYLIRHGTTDWNRINRFQGREDIPLNEDGIQQAKITGKALKKSGIEAVYTSPLSRAVRTAQEIALQTGLGEDDVYPMKELIERDLGPYSGQMVKDKQEYFAVAAGAGVSGMEPFDNVLVRMQQAMLLMEREGFASVAAVSHGAAINVLLAGLSNHEVGTGKTKLHNGGISIIEGNASQGFQLVRCNMKPEEFISSVNPTAE